MSKARIWSYARALGKALIQIAPEDFRMDWPGPRGDLKGFSISCTIATQQEAEAVCEIVMHLARSTLTRHRDAIRGDFYPAEPKPSFREELETAFGPTVIFETVAAPSGLVCVDCGKPRAKGSAARCRPCYEMRSAYAKELGQAADAA